MGFLDSVVEIGSFGLVDDVTGTEAAARAGREGQAAATADMTRMYKQGLSSLNDMWGQQRRTLRSWDHTGKSSLRQFNQLMRGDYDLTEDPVYQQRVAEQTRILGASGAGKGMQLSGRALADLSQMSSAEMGSAYNRRAEGLMGKMRLGSAASMGLAQLGGQNAVATSNLMTGHGTNLAQGHTNMAAINANAATSSFNNLMTLGQTVGGLASGFSS